MRCSFDSPATFTTEPFGASEPVSTLSPPSALIGFEIGCTTVPSGAGGSMSARFSAIVLPVTVTSSPCSSPSSSRCFEHDRHAADPVEIGHVELAAGLHVGEVRHPGGDLVEVVEVEFDAGLVGDREQVQHRVGRAAEGVGQRHRVLERTLGQDVVRPQAGPQHVDHGRAGPPGVVLAAPIDGGRRRRAGQRQPERLADRAHRVGGEHATARALAGAGVLLDRVQFVAR